VPRFKIKAAIARIRRMACRLEVVIGDIPSSISLNLTHDLSGRLKHGKNLVQLTVHTMPYYKSHANDGQGPFRK
jgi:hypothetical protein